MRGITHKLIMLKPMQPGLGGFARLQSEGRRTLAQVNVRGLSCKGLRAFWYLGGGLLAELGTAAVNAKGEAFLEGELSGERHGAEQPRAILLAENAAAPRPLLIGLCAAQSPADLLDAKNASLSLCERLKRESAPRPATVLRETSSAIPSLSASASRKENGSPTGQATPAEAEAASVEAAVPQPCSSAPPGRTKKGPENASPLNAPTLRPFSPPREIFLPAIDPSPYVPAEERPASVLEERPIPASVSPPVQEAPAPPPRQGTPVERLPDLRWPKAFAGLREYFERLPPCRVLNLPGWRFVCVSRQEDGLWIGCWQQDGAVRRVAYAMRGEPERDGGRPYQRMVGVDGKVYRVLVQRGGDPWDEGR